MCFKRLFERTQILLALAMVTLSGCPIGHPFPHNEVYNGRIPESVDENVYIDITRWGMDNYRDGVKQIWVEYPDGRILRFSWLNEDPSHWQVSLRHPDGQEEIIPLKKYDETMNSVLHTWPGEWDFERRIK